MRTASPSVRLSAVPDEPGSGIEESTLLLPDRSSAVTAVDPDASAEFSDVEGERLFTQLRSRLFDRHEELTIGRYRVLRRLGIGAMGEVHLARDEELDRPIAIKFVHAHLAGPRFADALRQEARALARLAHANVVHVYEVGEFRSRVFLAMEYVEGESLREWIRSQAPSWEEVLAAYLAAARGLAAAHGAGVVHRDFKPDNILRGVDGRVAVADFGLAALERQSETLDDHLGETLPGEPAGYSHTGEIKGTPAYMPPEQFLGESDARSDQFALCVALYEGLWARRPFPRRSLDELLESEADWTPLPPPKRNPAPSWLWPILRRGLAPEPEDRWASVDELIAAIETELRGRRRRARLLGSGLVALAVGLLSGAAVAWWGEPEPVEDCAAVELELAETWDASRREQLAEVFASAAARPGSAWLAESGALVARDLDRWRERWLESRAELCHARAGGDPVVLDRHGACLERHRHETEAIVDLLLAGGPETLSEAGEAVHGLPDPLGCKRDARQGGPPEPPAAVAERVADLRDELPLAEAELATARYEAALTRVEALEARARPLDYAPLAAEIANLHGRVLLASQRRGPGYEHLEQAADLAEGARHDRVVADSWLAMATAAAVHDPELERARRWLRRAKAAASRVGADPLTSAGLAAVRGNLSLRAEELDAAVAELERARALFEEQGDLLHASYATSNLGKALLERGDEQRAVAEFERALEQREQVYGPRHPELAWAAYNLGQVLVEAQPELARSLLERAVEIWSQAESQRPADLGRAQFVLAQFELDAGEFERALDHARAAALRFELSLPAGDVAHAEAATLIGTASYFLGRAEDAVVAHRQAVAGYAETYGADDVYTAFFRVALGWSLLAAGETDEARETFEAGREVIEAKIGAGTEDSADVRLGLVAVELAAGEPRRAQARLAQFGRAPSDEMNRLCFELLRGLAGLRLDPRDEESRAALRRAGELGRGMAGGEATLAVLLASVGAGERERRLVDERG
jgi:tetratricopeptide (TPR) repeat protein